MTRIRYFSHPEIEYRASDPSNFPAAGSNEPVTTIIDLLEVHENKPIVWKKKLDHPQLLDHFRVCGLSRCFPFQYKSNLKLFLYKQVEELENTNRPQLRILCVT